MIQEIYDCFLIKAQLLAIKYKSAKVEEIYKLISNENEFNKFCDSIIKIIKEDSFILIDSTISDAVKDIIGTLKFKYNENVVVDKCNFIQGTINWHNAEDMSYKKRLKNEWILEQIEDRGLPIYLCVKDDLEYFQEYFIDDYLLLDTILESIVNEKVNLDGLGDISPSINYLFLRFPEMFCEADIAVPSLLRLCEKEKVTPVWWMTRGKAIKNLKSLTIKSKEKKLG